jgi:hypothetical protein
MGVGRPPSSRVGRYQAWWPSRAKDGGHDEQPDEGDVEEDGGGHTDADDLHHEAGVGREPGRRRDHDQCRAVTARALELGLRGDLTQHEAQL